MIATNIQKLYINHIEADTELYSMLQSIDITD